MLTLSGQIVLAGVYAVRAEQADNPAISGPSVGGATEPRTSGENAAGLPPAERYKPGGPVRVMPDLRLSGHSSSGAQQPPTVNTPVSPGVQERDLREAPQLPPRDPNQPPRVMPDLRESPEKGGEQGQGGGPPQQR